jgi:hypothetical protein
MECNYCVTMWTTMPNCAATPVEPLAISFGETTRPEQSVSRGSNAELGQVIQGLVLVRGRIHSCTHEQRFCE